MPSQPLSTQEALKVLLIESDPDKAGHYSDCLRRLGYSVQVANDGDVALLTEAASAFCALVVPFQVARREKWREAIERTLSSEDDIPVVILANEGSGSELVDALAHGASDFLVEPFSIEELATRLALLVQSRGRRSKDILGYADISMDRPAHAVTVSGRWMALTRKEYGILERLLLRPESVVTRPELLRSVWGLDFDPGTNVVDVHLARLRRKLKESECTARIATVWGVGIRLTRGAPEPPFRLLLEAAPDAMVVLDSEGRIVQVNSEAEALLGYLGSELAGRPVELLIPERSRTAHEQHRANLGGCPAARRMGSGLGLVARRKDGTEIPVDISLSSIEDGKGDLVVAALRSMEGRTLSEAHERRLQNTRLVRLAADITHELNNMLMAISGRVELALANDDVGEEMRSDLTEIGRASSTAASLTRELLTYARRQAEPPGSVCMSELFQHLDRTLGSITGSKIECLLELEEPLYHVRIGVDEMEQIVLNIVSNARDAIGDGAGTLRISAVNVWLDEGAQAGLEGEHVMLRISDTGGGMDLETREQVFQPFFTTKKHGTGLGLTSVRRYVERAGGRVQVDSEPGEGTVFTVYLPASTEGESE